MIWDRIRKTTLIASVICLLGNGLCTLLGLYQAADMFSPLCGLFAFVTILSVGLVFRKFRAPIFCFSGGVFFWMLGDMFFYFCMHVAPQLRWLWDAYEYMYRITSFFYAAGLILFVWREYQNQDILRLLVNAFLYSVGTYIIISAMFESYLGRRLNILLLTPKAILYILISNFIIVLTLMVMAERGFHHLSLFRVFMGLSLLVYGVLDCRFTYLQAANWDPSSKVIRFIFLVTVVMLAIALSSTSLARYLLEGRRVITKKESYFGETIAVIMTLFGFFLMLKSDMSHEHFFILLVATMAYFLLSKTLQANSLTKELLAREEAEKRLLQQQVSEQIEELTTVNEKLETASYLDTLTGLKNRTYWNLYQAQLISTYPDLRMILFSLDINFFKLINDTYGHAAGDHILKEYGRRLSTLQNEDIQAFRIGGDQFMICCVEKDEEFNVVRFSDLLLEVLEKPFEWDGREIHVTSSIGGAVYPDDSKNIEKLMNFAEFARNSVKHTGNISSCTFYREDFMPKVQRKYLLEQKLQEVDYDTDFELYYQPQVDALSGQLIGMEALVRWHEAELGIISPTEFIPIAEEIGIMPHMGEWIIAESMHQIVSWNQTFQMDLVMGINVSPAQLRDDFFAENFINMMQEIGAKPEWIDIEITEGIALNGNKHNGELIDQLKRANLTFSVDDFGTGYASFTNMINFQFDRIKIAKELVERLVESANARVVVEAITGMARGMNLRTIAEGVETKEQLDVLVSLGCEQIQGFYFGKPLSAEEFEETWML